MPKPNRSLRLAIILLLCHSGWSFAQTCGANIPVSTPDSRFKDNGNGTLTDKKTGLTWKQCLEGQVFPGCTGIVYGYDWQGALEQADSSVFAGYDNWRVPNVNELESLVEASCLSPAINLTQFPNTWAGEHWSSSPSADSGGESTWTVNFDAGYSGMTYRYSLAALRLVRGGS